MAVEDIAVQRSFVIGTILQHLSRAIDVGEEIDLEKCGISTELHQVCASTRDNSSLSSQADSLGVRGGWRVQSGPEYAGRVEGSERAAAS